MSVNRWIGGQVSRVQINTVTIGGTPAAGNTVGVTINGKNISYTLVTGDGTTEAATGLTNALRSAVDGEFQLVSWTSSAAVITATSATAGVPFTATGGGTLTTTATGGGATATAANVQAFLSPADVSDVLNWSAGSLPVAADDVIVDAVDQPMLWNLSALSGVTLNSFKVRDSFAPNAPSWIGNAVIHPTLDFREFRGTELVLQGITTLEINLNAGAPAGAFQFNVSAAQCALKVTGSGPSSVRQECVYWRGTHATLNTLQVYGGSVAISPLIYSSTGTAVFQTAQVISGTLRLESAVTVNTSATLQDSILDSRVTIPTLYIAGANSQVTMRDAAAVTTLSVDEGAVSWLSSGAIPTLKVGSAGSIDFSGSFTAVSVGSGDSTVTLDEGASYTDPEKRTFPFGTAKTLLLNRTGLAGVTLDFGEHIAVQVNLGP
jgi:hypothetical protein